MSPAVVISLRFVAWCAVLVLVLALGAERVTPEAGAVSFAIGAAAVAAAVALVAWRSRPWVRRLFDPLVAAGVTGGIAWLLGRFGPGSGFVPLHLERSGLDAPWPLLLLFAILFAARLLLPPSTGARVGRLVRVELGKLVAGRLLIVATLIVAAAPVLSGLSRDTPSEASGWSVWADLFGTGAWAAEIFVLVLGAVALAGEIGQGTMKMVLPHAYDRAEWVFAKALVLALSAAVLVTVAYASSGLVAGFTRGLGDVVRDMPVGFGADPEPQVFRSASTMRSHLIDVGLVSLGSAVSTTWLALGIGSFFSAVVPALSLAFLTYLVLRFGDLLMNLPSEVTRVFPPAYPDGMREIAANLGRGMNDRWNPAHLPDGLTFAALVAALALLVALRAFDRRELS